MKIRNKKTGEIGYLLAGKNSVNFFVTNDEWDRCGIYNSLAELNEEWEDYEEPKPWWYIDITLDVKQGELFLSNHAEQLKTVGNYFETREEAEKAVEKLKAIQRLKNYYLKFKLDFVKNKIDFTYRLDGTLHSSVDEERIIFEDMNLLFGGEE